MKSEGHSLFTDPCGSNQWDLMRGILAFFSHWKSGTKVKPSQILPGRFRALGRQAEREYFASYPCLPLGNQDIREEAQPWFKWHTGGTGGEFLPALKNPTGHRWSPLLLCGISVCNQTFRAAWWPSLKSQAEGSIPNPNTGTERGCKGSKAGY